MNSDCALVTTKIKDYSTDTNRGSDATGGSHFRCDIFQTTTAKWVSFPVGGGSVIDRGWHLSVNAV